MDYIYLAQALIPVIIVAIAAKFIIRSLDNQVDTLLALNNHQEEDIASLKATIDKYEDILFDIKASNHPKQPLSLDEGPDFVTSVW